MTDQPTLRDVAPAFVQMAHEIVWCIVGTTDTAGNPSTRVLHPIWEWDDTTLTGWIATAPQSLKARHLAENPTISLTYWAPNHDTCTANCDVTWKLSPEDKQTGWDRFANAPDPVGYDPSIIPGWDSPDSEGFGILELTPKNLRVLPGSLMLAGEGELLVWRR